MTIGAFAMMSLGSFRRVVRAAASGKAAGAIGVFLLSVTTAAPAAGQDVIARVKDYYANASYEEALKELAQVRPAGPLTSVTDAAAYQVFCLVALGREQEATEAIAAIVRVDPLYHPDETTVAPRIWNFFEKVRRPLLPAIVRQLYASAKDRLERKEAAEAKKDLDRVIALLDEIGTSEDQDLADLRTLALGFRDLATINAARAAAPPPPPSLPVKPIAAMPPPAPAAAPRVPVVYSSTDPTVAPPVVVSRTLPSWRAVTAVERLQTFRGQLEILVDEKGAVLSSRMVRPLRPDYDPELLKMVPSWKFKPAMKDGKPVRYRYLMDLELNGGRD
jgi:tetratricopeptide (TPR) repeat protein